MKFPIFIKGAIFLLLTSLTSCAFASVSGSAKDSHGDIINWTFSDSSTVGRANVSGSCTYEYAFTSLTGSSNTSCGVQLCAPSLNNCDSANSILGYYPQGQAVKQGTRVTFSGTVDCSEPGVNTLRWTLTSTKAEFGPTNFICGQGGVGSTTSCHITAPTINYPSMSTSEWDGNTAQGEVPWSCSSTASITFSVNTAQVTALGAKESVSFHNSSGGEVGSITITGHSSGSTILYSKLSGTPTADGDFQTNHVITANFN
ncbi:hypothetical protein [Scandinavium goeteborgense]|uniref:hypothetical protein n=1 Tax=Scandinavium goeteborgense TaxID=1851514 RepID=UPI000F673526|nr:hypothetical protein [Scandinavium goeteborgense]QKN79777.1 hypothetical protein A8O29_000115 [Scandinavium goeteborgense]